MAKGSRISSKASVSKAAVGSETRIRLTHTPGMAFSRHRVQVVREIRADSAAISKDTVRSNSPSCNSNKDSRVEGVAGEAGADGRTTDSLTEATYRPPQQP